MSETVTMTAKEFDEEDEKKRKILGLGT